MVFCIGLPQGKYVKPDCIELFMYLYKFSILHSFAWIIWGMAILALAELMLAPSGFSDPRDCVPVASLPWPEPAIPVTPGFLCGSSPDGNPLYPCTPQTCPSVPETLPTVSICCWGFQDGLWSRRKETSLAMICCSVGPQFSICNPRWLSFWSWSREKRWSCTRLIEFEDLVESPRQKRNETLWYGIRKEITR